MAAKTSNSKTEKPLNKSAFVRGFDPATPADEIVTKGKEAGLELTKKMIWTMQSEMRALAKGGEGGAKKVKKAGKKAKKTSKKSSKKASKAVRVSAAPATATATASSAKPAGAPAKARAASAPTASASGLEQKLKALIVEIGTSRAEEIYRSVRHQLSAITSTH